MTVSCYERVFHRPVVFGIVLSVAVFCSFGVIGSYTTGVLTTLQREFKLKSSEIGVILTINDIVGLVIVTPFSYFGSKGHRPRILGTLTLIYALGCFVSTIPQFVGSPHADVEIEYGSADGTNSTYTLYGNGTDVDLCVLDRDGDSEGDGECSVEEQAASGGQYSRAVWLIVSQALCGLGGMAYFPLGITYIDDGVSKKSAPMYVAALFMVGSLSSVFGYGVSALSLSYHTDFYQIDVDDLGYDDNDPRWIGAWWLGYLIYSGVFIVISIPFFFFPKEWPKRESTDEEMKKMNIDIDNDDPTSKNAFMIKDTMSGEGATLYDKIKGFFTTTLRIMTNVTYWGCCMASCAHLATLAGFFSFVGRYIQTQYSVSPAMTSVILGCVSTPTAFFGNLFGGLLVKKSNLSLKGLAWVGLLITVIACLLVPLNFAVGCENSHIAGLTVPYPGETQVDAVPPCLADCDCPSGVYTPVCGSDGITYITPCHAGCSESIEGVMSDETGATTAIIYSKCTCMGTNSTADDIPKDLLEDDLTVTQEICPRDCTARLIGFIVIFGVILLVNSMIKNPMFILKLRCVDPPDRAIGLGLGGLLIRVLGFVPAPIYFGAAIQRTCIMFQESCGKTGNCLVYDTDRLRYAIFGLVILLKVLAVVSGVVTVISIRKDTSGTYRHMQLFKKKDDEKEKPRNV